jgi:hypothetical protein
MDEDLRRRIEERARRLWEQDGCPESGLNAYLVQAEAELAGLSAVGEEDPQEALDHDPPGAGRTKPEV